MKRVTRAIPLLLIIVVGLLLIAGCSNDVWQGQPEQILSEYRVPPSAKKVAEGTGPLEFTAPEKGIIYVVDLDQPTTIYATDGGAKKEAYKIVLQALLLPGTDYYFDPAARLAGARNSERKPAAVNTIAGHRYRALFDTKEVKG
jgi:hypothetical protein